MNEKTNRTTITISTHSRDLLRELEEYPKEPFNNILLRVTKFYKLKKDT